MGKGAHCPPERENADDQNLLGPDRTHGRSAVNDIALNNGGDPARRTSNSQLTLADVLGNGDTSEFQSLLSVYCGETLRDRNADCSTCHRRIRSTHQVCLVIHHAREKKFVSESSVRAPSQAGRGYRTFR
jgi:hypothetical protein